MRNQCIEWKDKFLADMIKYDYYSYIAGASEYTLYLRPTSSSSNKFWGASRLTPSSMWGGYYSIAVLEGGMIQAAIDGYDAWMMLQNVYEPTVADQFHNYRKSIRAIYHLSSSFPEIWLDTNETVIELVNSTTTLMKLAYDNMGTCHTQMVIYGYYLSWNEQISANEARIRVDECVAALRQWVTSVALQDQLVLMSDLLLSELPFSDTDDSVNPLYPFDS